jgi:hypothetical protein
MSLLENQLGVSMDETVLDNIAERVMTSLESLGTNIGLMLREAAVEKLRENDKTATGDLIKSIDSEIEREASQVIVTVFTNMHYAQYIHYGTKPYTDKQPPIEPLMRWLINKGRSSGKYVPKGQTMKNVLKTGKAKLTEGGKENVRSIAFAIAKSIAKKGLKAYPFFEMALKSAESDINQKIKDFRTNDTA